MSDSRLIQWLRECYLADRAWYRIQSLTGSKVEQHQVLKDREVLASGLLHETVVPPSYAQDAGERAQLYEREKELLYGCFTICGIVDGRAVISPLLIYPAEFDAKRAGIVTIQRQRWRLNPRALEMLGVDGDGAERLGAALTGDCVGEKFVDALVSFAEAGDVDFSSLRDWPKLVDEKSIRAASKSEAIKLLPSAHLFLASRSVNTRGVLQELKVMSELPIGEWSAALRCLLGGEAKAAPEDDLVEGAHFVPDMLSEAQNRVLKAAREQVLSVCHGPPGTGKSFTIAAMAVDHVARGKSVLIVSQQDAAVDVVQRMVDKMAGGEYLTVRGGRGARRKEMSDFLDRCLASGAWKPRTGLASGNMRIRALISTLKSMAKAQRLLEEAMEDAVERGGLLAAPTASWLERLRTLWMMRNFDERPLMAQLQCALDDLQRMRMHQTLGLMQMQLENDRSEVVRGESGYQSLKMFLSGLRARKGSEQAERFAEVDHAVIRKVFPVWLVALDDLHGVVPLEREIFDLVIIDEASQCDLAQILPAMLRAKRAVVVGDRKQLRHVSFLSQAKQSELAERIGLAEEKVTEFKYRNRSLMDVAVDGIRDGNATAFLNEHYRSRAEIVGFSNRRFYGGAMHVMGDRPWEQERDGLTLMRCEGTRDLNGVNDVEVAKVLEILTAYADAEWNEGGAPSLGVVSPFRDQVEAVREAVAKQMAPDALGRLLQQHRLKVDTAQGFQGDERDAMILTLAVDVNSPHGARRFLEREDVFNVMVTRARTKQWVVSSLDGGNVPGTLLGDYLTHCATLDVGQRTDVDYRDKFVSAVEKVLEERGCRTWAFEIVAGVEVDLVAEWNGTTIGIDLIGYPSASREYVPVEMMRLLTRAGMKSVPVGYAEWMKRRDECLVEISASLGMDAGS